MRRLGNILCAVFAVCILATTVSCEKRPLLEISNTHYVRVYVDETILNVTTGFYNDSYTKPVYKSPTVLRVTLTDPETGNVKAERYLRNQGNDANGHYYDGYIIADPGHYKLMAYNFDTESTIIGSGHNRYEIKAYTNEIASHLYTKIPSRMKSMTKDDGKAGPIESIVYDPDHLFVADCGDLYVPYMEQIDTLKTPEGTPHFNATSIVKSYFMQIKVKGAQYVSSAVSLLEGMASSAKLNDRSLDQENPVVIYFEMMSDKDRARTADDEAIIYATFGMFGRVDGEANLLEVTFDFVTTYGVPYSATFDITEDFSKPEAVNNQWLLLDHEITIPAPPPSSGSGGGGFRPSVGDWGDVNTDIVI